jgi:hypothetical protein
MFAEFSLENHSEGPDLVVCSVDKYFVEDLKEARDESNTPKETIR